MALTKPVTAPAIFREKVSVGIVQNGPSGANVPTPDRHINTKASNWERALAKTPAKRKSPPRASGTATCSRRSPDLSECQEFRTMEIPATIKGRVKRMPTTKLLRSFAFCSALGSQKRNPNCPHRVENETHANRKTRGCRSFRKENGSFSGSDSASRSNAFSRYSRSADEIHLAWRG